MRCSFVILTTNNSTSCWVQHIVACSWVAPFSKVQRSREELLREGVASEFLGQSALSQTPPPTPQGRGSPFIHWTLTEPDTSKDWDVSSFQLKFDLGLGRGKSILNEGVDHECFHLPNLNSGACVWGWVGFAHICGWVYSWIKILNPLWTLLLQQSLSST